jgi:urate oxidase
VTSNGSQVAVVSGIDQLALMRTSGFRPAAAAEDASGVQDGVPRLLVGTLAARWTYTSPDVTFGSYRHGVRSVIVETFAAHARASVEHTLHAIAEVALASYPRSPTSRCPCGAAVASSRPVQRGLENPDDLFLIVDEPLGNTEVTVERGDS